MTEQGPDAPSPGQRRAPRQSASRLHRVLAVVPASWRGRRALAALLAVLVVLVGIGLTVTLASSGDDGGPEEPSAAGSPTSDEAGEESEPAEELTGVAADARTGLEAWARPDLSYREWWDGLRPLLSPGARSDYRSTDPAALPDLEVDGLDTVRPGPSDDTATVFLDTTEGRFGLDMSRRPGQSSWLVVRVLFPGQESSLR